ncbi:MAG: hypothetical protein KDI49_16025 [Gammaproteobacteria bacterium]|nr:hypothetical protein [Gammaproteobacteria bacterium]
MERLNQAIFMAMNASTTEDSLLSSVARFAAEWPVGIAIFVVAIALLRYGSDKRFVLIRLSMTVLIADRHTASPAAFQ